MGSPVNSLQEVVILFLANEPAADNPSQLVGEMPIHLPEAGIRIRLQMGIRAEIEGRAGHHTTDREFQTVDGVVGDVQIVKTGHPVEWPRLAGEAELLRQAESADALIVRCLVSGT